MPPLQELTLPDQQRDVLVCKPVHHHRPPCLYALLLSRARRVFLLCGVGLLIALDGLLQREQQSQCE